MTIAKNLKMTLPKIDNAKELMKFVKGHSQTVDKSLVGTLMSTLTAMKYSSSCTMDEHVLKMTTLAAKLKILGMTVDKYFLVQFILNSLPPEQYKQFQMNYNITKDKRNVNELINMLIQEKTRLNNQIDHSIHFLSHQEAIKNSERKSGKTKKKCLHNLNEYLKGAHKKEDGIVKCHFCNKNGRLKKNCLKYKVQLENMIFYSCIDFDDKK